MTTTHARHQEGGAPKLRTLGGGEYGDPAIVPPENLAELLYANEPIRRVLCIVYASGPDARYFGETPIWRGGGEFRDPELLDHVALHKIPMVEQFHRVAQMVVDDFSMCMFGGPYREDSHSFCDQG